MMVLANGFPLTNDKSRNLKYLSGNYDLSAQEKADWTSAVATCQPTEIKNSY